MTQMTPDLYKAILSMDSYNRGYNPSVKFGNLVGSASVDAPGTGIGNAKVFRETVILLPKILVFMG
jgi:hypothetical protein